MRIKKKTWILTFESTTQAMAADKFGIEQKLPGATDSDSAGNHRRMWSLLES